MLKGDIDDLICRLKGATYTDGGDGVVREYETRVLYGGKQEMFARQVITDWAIDHMAEMGRLQAKVTAYEAIISNSNFKMAVEETKETEREGE